MSEVRLLPIDRLQLDVAAECRDGESEETIQRYVEARDAGEQFPPVVVFDDGEVLRLADGKKRVLSAQRFGVQDIRAEVRRGGLREATLYAAGANLSHGLASSRADKRRAVEAVLRVASDLSDREIGRRCGVDHKTVGSVRQGLVGEIPQMDATRTVQRNGSTYTQETSRIGSKPPAGAASDDPSSPDFDEPPNVQAGDEPLVRPISPKKSRPWWEEEWIQLVPNEAVEELRSLAVEGGDRGIDHLLSASAALKYVRDRKAYLGTYETFDAFCEDRVNGGARLGNFAVEFFEMMVMSGPAEV